MMHRPKLCIAQLTALRGDGADMALGVALVLQYLYLNVFCIVSYNLYDMAVGGWWVGGVADSKQPGDKQTPNLAPSKDSYPTNLGRIWTYDKKVLANKCLSKRFFLASECSKRRIVDLIYLPLLL